MSRIAYVNGAYIHASQAGVSISDRGFQFGDGVYGVVALYEDMLIDLEEHLERFEGYGREICLELPLSRDVLCAVARELVRRNRVREGSLYLQLTRGVAPRVHAFPDAPTPASLVMLVKPQELILDVQKLSRVGVMTLPDPRWKRSYIKSTSLLPTVLLRQQAKESDCFETWLLDSQDFVCEGASSNAYIVTKEGTIVTRPQDGSLVPGVTRARLLTLAKEAGIPVQERPFSKQEALEAREAFLSGALSMVKSVVSIDGKQVGDGAPGPITKQLAGLYFDYCRAQVRVASPQRTSSRPQRPRSVPVLVSGSQEAWRLAS